MLQERGERPHRRLVTRHDGDESGDVVGVQMHVDAVVRHLATDQRVAHRVGAVELPIGHTERVRGSDQPHRQIVVADAVGEGGLDRLDLRRHPQVALAVAEVADHAPHRLMDLVGVLAQEAGRADSLHVASRVDRHKGGVHRWRVAPSRRERETQRKVPLVVLPFARCGHLNSASSCDRDAAGSTRRRSGSQLIGAEPRACAARSSHRLPASPSRGWRSSSRGTRTRCRPKCSGRWLTPSVSPTRNATICSRSPGSASTIARATNGSRTRCGPCSTRSNRTPPTCSTAAGTSSRGTTLKPSSSPVCAGTTTHPTCSSSCSSTPISAASWPTTTRNSCGSCRSFACTARIGRATRRSRRWWIVCGPRHRSSPRCGTRRTSPRSSPPADCSTIRRWDASTSTTTASPCSTSRHATRRLHVGLEGLDPSLCEGLRRVHRRQPVRPRLCGLELRSKSEQRRLVTEGGKEVRADREALVVPPQRHRHRRVAGEVGDDAGVQDARAADLERLPGVVGCRAHDADR